jgi:hypothetical protein
MENFTNNSSDTSARAKPYAAENVDINGWAIDADKQNDPTYPMRRRENEDTKNCDWQRPSLQSTREHIFHSTERPNLTAVFGTSAPPKGVSGKIRAFAFKYSEGKLLHWLSLLLADRVDMVEGVISDLSTGHVPNLLKESGLKAQWKHNPDAVIKKAIIGVGVIALFTLAIKRKQRFTQ